MEYIGDFSKIFVPSKNSNQKPEKKEEIPRSRSRSWISGLPGLSRRNLISLEEWELQTPSKPAGRRLQSRRGSTVYDERKTKFLLIQLQEQQANIERKQAEEIKLLKQQLQIVTSRQEIDLKKYERQEADLKKYEQEIELLKLKKLNMKKNSKN